MPSMRAEGTIAIDYAEQSVELTNGTKVSLRHPTYDITDLSFGPLAAETTLSPRIAPQMIGLGLIEAIHPADIAANADPRDRDGDGISGRISLVRDPQIGRTVLGRFGWKASQPTLIAQNAASLIATSGSRTRCTRPQPATVRLSRRPASPCRTVFSRVLA